MVTRRGAVFEETKDEDVVWKEPFLGLGDSVWQAQHPALCQCLACWLQSPSRMFVPAGLVRSQPGHQQRK